ncbi:MAG: TIGR01777 family protein [Bacteroidetes bacterium]|nr:TIGR01777 family protein [Bacteroidota bacterium]
MSTYIIAGGSGFVGSHLSKILLAQSHQIIILSTKKKLPQTTNPQLQFVYWDPTQSVIDKKFSCQQAIVINLAGAGVADKRWTRSRKQEILLSRVQSLATLYKAAQNKQIGIEFLLSASAIGWYGEGEQNFTEEDANDTSYLSMVCKQWESEANTFEKLAIPVGIVRIGIVLGEGGGAFHEFMKPLKYGLAGIPAGGKQMYSWIHVEDVCQGLVYLSKNKASGIFNLVAPNPVMLRSIFNEMIICRNAFTIKLSVPAFILKIVLGEMSVEILKSCRVSSQKLQDLGFRFQYPEIKSCIHQLMHCE